MTKRLIGLREMDTLEGLVEQHHKLQESLEGLEAEAAAYDLTPPGVAQVSASLEEVRLELKAQLEGLCNALI